MKHRLAFSLPLEKTWLELNFVDTSKKTIKKPEELERDLLNPPVRVDDQLFDRIAGSIIGMTIGDALGAHVEFRPREYLLEHPVTNLSSGGTWGLAKGQVRLSGTNGDGTNFLADLVHR